MAAIVPASNVKNTAWAYTEVFAKFSTVSDADTWASGFGSRVVSYVGQVTSDPTTNTSAGINITESSGTFTFYPGVDALGLTMIVRTTGA